MGFWSSIGSAFSSACSAVGSALSSACGAIGSTFSSACSGVFNAIAGIASVANALASVGRALGVALPYLQTALTVVTVIDMVLQALGLAGKDEKVEDLGQDVLDAYEADIKPADYSTYDEYMQAIRNFRLENPDKQGNHDTTNKLIAGISVQTWGLEEKIGAGSGEILSVILKDAEKVSKGEGYFTPERTSVILTTVSSVADVVKYFSGKLDMDNADKVEQQLIKAEQQLNPDKSVSQIYQELDEHRQKS